MVWAVLAKIYSEYFRYDSLPSIEPLSHKFVYRAEKTQKIIQKMSL
jgi:hypothetical protein